MGMFLRVALRVPLAGATSSLDVNVPVVPYYTTMRVCISTFFRSLKVYFPKYIE